MQQWAEDSSQRQRDLLHRLLRDYLLRLAHQAGLWLEVGLPRRVLLAAVVVAAPAASSSLVPAVPARGLSQAAVLLPQDSSEPEHLDSYLRLRAALVPEAELVRAKPTRTRVNRDRW